MKVIFTLCILAFVVFNNLETKQSEFDMIDAYNLKINGVPLFGNITTQIDSFGLPEQAFQHQKAISFRSKKELLNRIAQYPSFTTIQFNGTEFWCFNDLESIPSKIDFRKFDSQISNGTILYDKTYTLNKFKKEFPNSYKNQPKTPVSFFQMSTKENTTGLKHYFVERSSKSDANVKLLVEFTFKNDRLIYILFINF